MKIIAAVIVALIAADIALLFSDGRILIDEKIVRPGETYVVADYGDLGAAQQSSLVCRYFTGRSILTTVLWYSSNGAMGSDSCIFFQRGR